MKRSIVVTLMGLLFACVLPKRTMEDTEDGTH